MEKKEQTLQEFIDEFCATLDKAIEVVEARTKDMEISLTRMNDALKDTAEEINTLANAVHAVNKAN